MKQGLTDITMVLDRSGSMSAVRNDAIGGMNTFIEDQKQAPGDALFTLIQFDHEFEIVLSGVPIRDVGPQTMVPRGNTALLDALGRTIVSTGERLAKMSEADRPALVIIVTQTDGQENSSSEYTFERVSEMIKKQQEEFSWKFIFLGADIASAAFARSVGMRGGSVAVYASHAPSAGMHANSANVSRMRGMGVAGMSSAGIGSDYTDEEVEQAKGEKDEQ